MTSASRPQDETQALYASRDFESFQHLRLEHINGNELSNYQEGSEPINYPEGSEPINYPNGTDLINYPDGSETLNGECGHVSLASCLQDDA